MSEWLDNLEIGDKVVIVGLGDPIFTTIGRFTKTLIFTKKGTKFRRRDGSSFSKWDRGFLQEPSQKIVDQVRQVKLVNKLRRYNWKSLSLETLSAVSKLLPYSETNQNERSAAFSRENEN